MSLTYTAIRLGDVQRKLKAVRDFNKHITLIEQLVRRVDVYPYTCISAKGEVTAHNCTSAGVSNEIYCGDRGALQKAYSEYLGNNVIAHMQEIEAQLTAEMETVKEELRQLVLEEKRGKLVPFVPRIVRDNE